MKRFWILPSLLVALSFATGCSKSPETDATPPGPSAPAQTKIKLALNWKPEPEFGGFYAARESGEYSRAGRASGGLDVEIISGGDQVAQMLESGDAQVGILAADEVVAARARGLDVVALFATYQTNPQGIMAHKSRGLKSIEEIWKAPGTLAVQPGLHYYNYLKMKYGQSTVKVVTYDYSIAGFIGVKDYSQQCFITSEPLTAAKQGEDPQVFLIADTGYNPYAGVVVAMGRYVKKNQKTIKDFVEATRAGWQSYLTNPRPANEAMAKLNKEMSPETFAAAAETQKELIAPKGFKDPLGTMDQGRWQTLIQQLADLKVIEKSPPPPLPEECYIHVH
jgi:NitT/TauT family transport system substrate-binding protein